MIGTCSLRCYLDDSGLLHLDFVDDVFVHGVRQHLRRSAVSRTSSATMYDYKCVTALDSENQFDSRPVFVKLSFVGGRLVQIVSGHPRPSLSGTSAPWVSLLGPTGVPQSPG